MVTDNQKAATTIVVLAAVLLLTFVPFSHSLPIVFAAGKQASFSGMNHATTSFAFASHKQGQFTGLSHATTSSSLAKFPDTTQGQGVWNQDPYQQQHNKKWHHHGDPSNNINNIQNADCISSSTATGGDANGGSGGSGNGGSGGSSPGGSGGSSNGGTGWYQQWW